MGRQGWGGYAFPNHVIPYANLLRIVTLMTPFLTLEEAVVNMKLLNDLVESLGNVAASNGVRIYDSFYDIYEAEIANGLETSANNVGVALASRLVPAQNFDGVDNQQNLAEALYWISTASGPSQVIPLFICLIGPRAYYSKNTPSASAVTPAWKNATWHVIATHSFANEADVSNIEMTFQQTTDSMNPLRELTPGSGAYQNEADCFEPDYANWFWGAENYERLMGTKQELDAKNVLAGHQTVGWNENDERYSCYPKAPS